MFYWFLKCLLRVSLQSPGIPFFQCIKLYQVTCYSLSQIQLAIKFEYIKLIFAHTKKTSQRLISGTKMPKTTTTIPQQNEKWLQIPRLVNLRRFGTNILLVSCAHPNLKEKLTRTAQHGPPDLEVYVFFLFFRGKNGRTCPCVLFLQWIFNVFHFFFWNFDSEI